jgi:tetratricopeptide (TPR) repeat protein
MSGLPAGHPNVDPNNPIPAPPLSSLPTPGTPTEPTATATSGSNLAPPPEAKPEEGGYDLTYDDAGVRAAIQHASDYQALVHIGNEQFDAKHPRLAIAAYEKALKIHPFDPDVQTDLGVMYRATHRPSDAIKAFRNAASLDPKHAQSRYNLGVVLAFDANDMKGAIAAWKDYLRVAPPGPQAEDVKRQVEAMEKQVGKS